VSPPCQGGACPVLRIKTADCSRTFDAEFTVAGRQPSSTTNCSAATHASVARGRWYVEDSFNGTWLNGRRIHATQWLKKGDKIQSGAP
jgi:pSer/pThr/pTyr-binding forkhead associated (FHA) protein